MYDTFFGLDKRPFPSIPQIDWYYPATTIEAARIALTRCIERGEGVGVVIGPTGTGKTLLCRLLAEHFKKSLPVVELCGHLSSRRSLYQAVLYGLGQPYRGLDEGELRLALVDYLTLGRGPHPGMVLIVDEAHTLPLRLLDEIRMLTNLAQQGRPLVLLVLAASGSLEERLAGPKMDSFNQRISARCYLESLGRAETQDYIHSQIDSAGGSGADLFPEESCQCVFQATDGVPRLINQLCDHALLLAYIAGRRIVQPAQIEEAWADLQQLPTPWNGDNRHEQGGVIEFGRLDDSADASPQTVAEESSAQSLRVARDFQQGDSDFIEFAAENKSIEPAALPADDFQPPSGGRPELELVFDDVDHPFQEEFEHEELITDRYTAADTALGAPFSSPAAEPPVDDQETSNRKVEALSWDQADVSLPRPSEQNAIQSTQCAASPVSVLEEQNAAQVKPRAVSTLRRHEYSRLFAKLRHG
jgi:type II secretory pathway predicted ATPase ExeA